MRPQSCTFTSGVTGVYYLEPSHLFRIMGKEICFAQNWSDNDVKNYRLQDFYHILDLHV